MKEHKPILNAGVCSIAYPNDSGAICDSPEETLVSDIIEKIQSGIWKEKVTEVRSRAQNKKSLPLVLFSGKFDKGTKNEDQVSRSGYAVVDFDYKDNIGKDWQKLRKQLVELPFVASFFTSARGEGLKALVRIPDNMTPKESTAQVLRLLSPVGFKIDDLPRAFTTSYVSYDPDAMPFREAQPIPTEDLDKLPFELLKQIFSETFDQLYSLGNGKYFDTQAWSTYPETQAWRCLNTAGFPQSHKDKAFKFIARERALDDVVSVRSAHDAGYYNEGGCRFLVRSSPKLIEAKQGDFQNIERLLKSRFMDPANPEQYWTFLTWLKRARKRLKTHREAYAREEVPKDEVCLPGLIIVGNQGIGKSKIFTTLILPLLGGRKVDGKKILCEASQFNSPLLEGEAIVVDDYETTSKFSRGQFAGKLKEVLFSSCVGTEGKFKNESSSSRICPIFVQLLNEERIETTPDYYSVRDKVIFLYGDKYIPLEEDANGKFEQMNEAIERELPAFAYYLDNLKLPESVLPTPGCSTEQRVGMKHYVHPVCKDLLDGSDNAFALLNEYDARATGGFHYNQKLSAGKIQEIAGNTIKGSVSYIGKLLKSLSKRFPKRVEQVRSGGQCRGWTIHPPPQ